MSEDLTLLAVDVANIHFTLDRASRADYAAPLDFARGLGRLVRASAYTANTGSDRDRALLLKLKYLGYDRTRSRPLHIRTDGRRKCDADVSLVMDCWESAVKGQMNRMVLVTGDGDFVPLVHGLANRGIEVWVIGPDRCTAPDLILASSHFVNANDVPGFIQHSSDEPPAGSAAAAESRSPRELALA